MTKKILKIPKKAQKQQETQAQIINNYIATPKLKIIILGTSRTHTIYYSKRYNN